jgi:hypothetical protein
MTYRYNSLRQAHVWSNLAYLIAGFIVLPDALLPAIGLWILALGSAYGHYHGGRAWVIDWIAMYLCFLFIAAHYISPGLLALAPVIILAEYHFNRSLHWLIGLCWAIVTFLSFLYGSHTLLSIVFFIAGYACKRVPTYKKYFNFWHTLWHILTAIGFILIIK